MIGNGFSQSLVEHLNLSKRIITSPLLPLPTSIQYLPFENDRYPMQPIWSKNLFPLLWDYYKDFGMRCSTDEIAFKIMCQRFADEERHCLMTLKNRGEFSIGGGLIFGYQLRAYLFNLFRGYDNILINTVRHNEDIFWQWGWLVVLKSLFKHYEVKIISFNYDCIVENVIQLLGYVFDEPMLDYRYDNAISIYKPHGSISHSSAMGFDLGNKKWLAESTISNCVSSPFVINNYPPSKYPTIPDLVPPGFAGSHLINPFLDFSKDLGDIISACESLILCGLSAAQPDTFEIKGYLANLEKNTPVIHVGLPEDQDVRKNKASELLKEYGAYNFCDVKSKENGVESIPHILERIILEREK